MNWHGRTTSLPYGATETVHRPASSAASKPGTAVSLAMASYGATPMAFSARAYGPVPEGPSKLAPPVTTVNRLLTSAPKQPLSSAEVAGAGRSVSTQILQPALSASSIRASAAGSALGGWALMA